MFLEIVTPEKTVFSADVTSVTVPGVEGEFQMLDNHAPIISLLDKGLIKIAGSSNQNALPEDFSKGDNNQLYLKINGGVVEMKNNKAIVLAN